MSAGDQSQKQIFDNYFWFFESQKISTSVARFGARETEQKSVFRGIVLIQNLNLKKKLIVKACRFVECFPKIPAKWVILS